LKVLQTILKDFKDSIEKMKETKEGGDLVFSILFKNGDKKIVRVKPNGLPKDWAKKGFFKEKPTSSKVWLIIEGLRFNATV
jgi:hypothetical protein